MNWYAHAVVAEQRTSDPLGVLGAMLPDLAAALRLRVVVPAEGAVALGLRLHSEADALFHGAPEFLTLQSAGRASLEAAGLPRGSARAAAHVGIELSLDGWLALARRRSPVFLAAVDAAAALADQAELFRGGFEPGRWVALCTRLREGDLPEAYASPERSALGVERALAPRARLALPPGARDAVAEWLRSLQPALTARAPALLARAGL